MSDFLQIGVLAIIAMNNGLWLAGMDGLSTGGSGLTGSDTDYLNGNNEIAGNIDKDNREHYRIGISHDGIAGHVVLETRHGAYLSITKEKITTDKGLFTWPVKFNTKEDGGELDRWITIPTTDEQEMAVTKEIYKIKEEQKYYHYYSTNCVVGVCQAARAGGQRFGDNPSNPNSKSPNIPNVLENNIDKWLEYQKGPKSYSAYLEQELLKNMRKRKPNVGKI